MVRFKEPVDVVGGIENTLKHKCFGNVIHAPKSMFRVPSSEGCRTVVTLTLLSVFAYFRRNKYVLGGTSNGSIHKIYVNII